ncbi:MAG TPA: hypothetical protein PKM56_16285 [Candidatus Rifleibacterium sp.]|nr:hypothetical protein [Candidatus Rifleibacterium sp.]
MKANATVGYPQVDQAIVSGVLQNILPGIIHEAGQEIERLKARESGQFSFKLRGFNRQLDFTFDGLLIEMAVSFDGEIVDLIPVVGVPLVKRHGKAFYACWLGKKRLSPPYDLLEKLVRRYFRSPLQRWLNELSSETMIAIYKASGCTLVRLVDNSRPALKKDEALLVCQFPVLD